MTSLWSDDGITALEGAIDSPSARRSYRSAPSCVPTFDPTDDSDTAVIDPPQWFPHGKSSAEGLDEQNADSVVSQLADVHRHIGALDGIRGLAILLVMCHHLLPENDTTTLILKASAAVSHIGRFGVDLFFVLSGFLITGILLDSIGKPNYFRRFYIRRSLRIMPLYYGVLLAVLVGSFVATLFHNSLGSFLYDQKWLWIYATNFVLADRHDWAFQGEWLKLSHFWSLAVEEHFYLVWPAVVFALTRRRLMACCALMIVVAPLVRMYCMVHFDNYLAAYTLTPCRVDTLALGALIALLAREKSGLVGVVKFTIPLLIAAVIGMAGVLLYTGGFKSGHPLIPTLGYSCIDLLCTAVLLWALGAPLGGLLQRFWTNPLLMMLGKYSYGLYVFHYLFQPAYEKLLPPLTLQPYVGHTASVLTASFFAMIASLAIAITSFHLIESPMLKLKRYFP